MNKSNSKHFTLTLLFLTAFLFITKAQTSLTYTYTGSMQSFTVPSCVTSITIDARGSKGGDCIYSSGSKPDDLGGLGGRVVAVYSVTPGQILNIFVGGIPYNGGGNGAGSIAPANGGGASDVRIGGVGLIDRVIVAGGGGGGGNNCSPNPEPGGDGGGLIGSSGWDCLSQTGTYNGKGGTQFAGGAAGTSPATPGSLGVGGNGGGAGTASGGGGGGYYGGGGAGYGGGGGGSSFTDLSATSVVHTQGFNNGTGIVIISYGPTSVAINSTSSNICSGSTATLSTSSLLTYSWSNGSNTATTQVSPTVTTTYSLVGMNLLGCPVVGIISIGVNSVPTLTVNSGTICSGNSFTISPTGASTYTYSGGSSVVSPTATTNYTVTGASALGCTNTAVSSVTVNSVPTITVNNGAICSGNSFTISPSGASTYTYSGGSSVVSPTSTTNYTVTGASALGCTNTAVSTVTVNSVPTLTVNSGAICSGNSFTISPTGASTYTYSGGSSVVSPTATTNYTVTGASALGCTNTAVSSVTVNALPTISATTSNTLLCTGETASLTASGASTYNWSTSQTTSAIAVSPTTTTVYTVTGTDANGCVNTTTITQDVSLCTGITPLSIGEGLGVRLYPNPTNGIITIELATVNNNTKVELLNTLGQVLLSEITNIQHVAFNMYNYPAGVYFIKVTANNTQQTIKVIKE